jgi:putative endonuclease
MGMEWVVYILWSEKHKQSYVGITSNLVERFKSHNELGKGFTTKFRPWMVIHIEVYDSKELALKREKYLKSGRGLYLKKEIIKSIIKI